MPAVLRGCLGRLVFLATVIVVLVAGFVYRDRVRAAWAALRGESAAETQAGTAVSAELAATAQEKLDALARGDRSEAVFGTAELQSLLEYRYLDRLPAFIDSPRVEVDGGRVRLSMRIPVDRFPGAKGLGEVAALLPDTTDLVIRGALLAAEDGKVAFAIDGVSAHSIPLPRRLVPGAIEMLGLDAEPGLPADAITVPLPPGARAAYIRGDSIVILSSVQRPRD
jgi:hypothetical protein